MFSETAFDDGFSSEEEPMLPRTTPASPCRSYDTKHSGPDGSRRRVEVMKGREAAVPSKSSTTTASSSSSPANKDTTQRRQPTSATSSAATKKTTNQSSRAAARCVAKADPRANRLHKAGDAAFRFTCVPPTGPNSVSNNNGKGRRGGGDGGYDNSSVHPDNRFDDRFATGDAWASDVCHCMLCEVNNAFSIAKAAQDGNAVTPVLLPAALLGALPPSASSATAAVRVVPATNNNRSSDQPSTTTTAVTVPPTLVLWDLDNYGFNHLKQDAHRLANGAYKGATNSSSWMIGRKRPAEEAAPSQTSSDDSDDDSNNSESDGDDEAAIFGSSAPDTTTAFGQLQQFAHNTIFWFFYGACFSRRHSVTPAEYLKAIPKMTKSSNSNTAPTNGNGGSAENNNKGGGATTTPEHSVWALLRDHSQGGIIFTPCAGHSQAADEVMSAIALGMFPTSTPSSHEDQQQALLLPPLPTILVTRDKGLMESVQTLAGNCVKAVRCVDPQAAGGGPLVPFWADLSRNVEEARKEYVITTLFGGPQ